jgi:transcriptional regulator with XRE-family HTH domain
VHAPTVSRAERTVDYARGNGAPAVGLRIVKRVTVTPAGFGQRLRRWREHRHLTQLDLALQAEISTRHLSFVETGRASPSRDMVLRLAEHLDVPLRERNALLLSAGFAPAYGETALDAPAMEQVRAALRQLLDAHEPFPGIVVDRQWNLVESNVSATLFLANVAPQLLEPPINVLRLSLHPEGLSRSISNLAEWRAHLLDRLQRQVALTNDPEVRKLYDELRGYPGGAAVPPALAGEVVTRLRLRTDTEELSFFTVIASFGTPIDITLAELAIEWFFPADAHTADILRARQTLPLT